MALLTSPKIGPLRHTTTLALGVAGAESNVAIGAQRLGVQTAWVGRVGDDEFGRLVLSAVRGEGVDVSRVVVEDSAPTGLMVKERRAAGLTRVSYYRSESAGSRLCPGDLDEALVRSAQVLHVTGITAALSPSAREAVRAAVATARDSGVTVSLDLNYRRALWAPDEAGAVLRDLVTAADVVFATEDEAGLVVAAETDAGGLANALADLGPAHVLVKRGARGAVGWCDGEVLDLPAHTVECVDPVGAGDAFAAAWLAEWVCGVDAKGRLAAAVAAGAFAVTAAGDWEGLPSREDLRVFVAAGTDVHR
jgi:2-dehydro-3-deoxygluconokinase